MQRQGGMKEPVLLQGDFRKVSGISSEIFRQIEAVENDHDPSTAAALEVKSYTYLFIRQILLMLFEFMFYVGCGKTWGDDCKNIGTTLYWKSSII